MVNNEIRLIIFFTAEDGEVLYSQQKLDRELTVAQIPYNYAVEMTNRFKGLDLIECLKNYGQSFWTKQYRFVPYSTGGSDQDNPQEKEM